MRAAVSIPKVRWIALAGTAVASLCALYGLEKLRQRRRRRRKDDLYYLAICQKLRVALSKPRHSNFRVVAMLLLDNGDTIMGANDEGSPTISGAICAERGALMQYRVRYGGAAGAEDDGPTKLPRIDTVFVVSDHPTIRITPGCLCREYLYGHPAIDLDKTRVVLQCADSASAPATFRLPQLYPFASPTARLSRKRAMETSEAYEETVRSLMSQPFSPFELPPNDVLPWTTVQQVYHAACSAARNFVTHDHVYPIRIAAASACISIVSADAKMATVEKIDIATSVQVPALEYGCTEDVVCQVLQRNEHDSHSIIFLVQVDQWGLPHAPFALARNALCERSMNQQQCTFFVLVGMRLRIVPGTDLYPTLPTIF
jgi:cytidine deaminase